MIDIDEIENGIRYGGKPVMPKTTILARCAEIRRLRNARNDAMEEASHKIRADCGMCNGSGYADQPGVAECEYCGRPMQSVRALKDKQP